MGITTAMFKKRKHFQAVNLMPSSLRFYEHFPQKISLFSYPPVTSFDSVLLSLTRANWEVYLRFSASVMQPRGTKWASQWPCTMLNEHQSGAFTL